MPEKPVEQHDNVALAFFAIFKPLFMFNGQGHSAQLG